MARRRKGSTRYELIKRLIESLPREYVKCRALGHAWGEEVKKRMDDGGWRVFAFCGSCESERYVDWSIYGEIEETGGYLYSDGYVLTETGPLETADRNIIRAIYLELVPEEK